MADLYLYACHIIFKPSVVDDVFILAARLFHWGLVAIVMSLYVQIVSELYPQLKYFWAYF